MANSTTTQYPQRIAMLSVHTSPLAPLGRDKTGGMNVYVRDFSRELSRQGIGVDIFTRATAVDQPLVEPMADDVRVVHVPAGPRQPINVNKLSHYLAEFSDGVLRFAGDQAVRYDLIHSHYWLSGLVADQLHSAWGGLPRVQMFHTLGHMKNEVAQSEHERAPDERITGECGIMQRADRLIAPTETEHKQLVNYYGANPQKIVVIPPGVDLTRFHAIDKEHARARVNLPADRRHIVFTGRIEPLKGIDTLLHAIALLRKRRPELTDNARVTIIGGDLDEFQRDSELTRLYELHCALNLCGMVGFVGAKEQTVLPYYLAAADMVVMPSLYESFGLVALEAMAAGTPVIASRVGGLAHLVQDGVTGFTVPPRDPEALASRIEELLSNPDLGAQLGRQASEYARLYEWPAIVQRMVEEVYLPLVCR